MAIKNLHKIADREWRRIMRTIGLSNETTVKVGILGTDAKKSHGALSNVALATVHEFGSSDGRVPERSFLRSTFAANRDEYMRLVKLGVRAAFKGKAPIEETLKRIGLRMENDVKKNITTGAGIPPPNAPSTIARKGSSRPLVDTGQLVGAITSAVVVKKRGGA
jgi:phage gpG-like protein